MDALKEQVENGLVTLTVEELGEVCTEIDLPIPNETVKGNKIKLKRHLLTHLWSEGDKEEQDGGFATYKIVHEYLIQLQKKGEDVKPKIGVEPEKTVKVELKTLGNADVTAPTASTSGEGGKVSAAVGAKAGGKNVPSTVVSKLSSGLGGVKSQDNAGVSEGRRLERLPTLKITGVIGGEKDNITFDNLRFQIENAVAVGYTEQSICGAVIKAICPSNSLRVYFETEQSLCVDTMIDILHPYLVQNKDSSSYFAELCGEKQRPPDKSAMDFVVRLLGLKNLVFKLSAEEGTPFDRNLMRKQFFKTMYSGVKNMNIRAEVRENCNAMQDKEIRDHQLMKIVAEAMGNEKLRAENFTQSKEVNSVETHGARGGNERLGDTLSRQPAVKGKNKENLLPCQVDKQQQELTVLKGEVEELRGQNNEIKSLLIANNNLLKAAQVNAATAVPLNPGYFPNVNAPTWPQVPQQQTGNQGSGNQGNGNQNGNLNKKKKGFPRKCPNCHQNNVFRCTHCWDCGGTGHKRGECPEDPGNH